MRQRGWVVGRRDGARMPHPQRAVGDRLAHRRWEIEQTQEVGNMTARLMDKPAKRILGVAEIVDQAAIGFGLLDRVQVFALDVLDKRDLERFCVGKILDDHRHVVKLGTLRRAPAALAGNNLIIVPHTPDDDRLDNPACPN